MKNKTLTSSLIATFILFLLADFFRTLSFAIFALCMISEVIFLIFSIWAIIRLYKLHFAGVATFGIFALIISQSMPHGYSNPLYLAGVALLIVYVVVVAQKLNKIV